MDIKSPVAEARNEYTYSAGGQKLKVVQKWNPNYNTAPVVGSDITVSTLTQSKTTDYVGNIIYESHSNGTSKTRILVDGGYVENGVYYYYIADHLGNNRVVVNASGTVIQKNHYYPFGMSFAENSVAEQGLQPYKYNNKELDAMHGVNLYDYGARHKDDFRFITVDPLAEKYYSISPYVYCNNNPIRFIDPTGMVYGEYELNNKGEWVKTSNVGDNIGVDFYHTGLEKNGKEMTIIKDKVGNSSMMFGGRELLKGGEIRSKDVDWGAITSEYFSGKGPDNSIFEGDHPSNLSIQKQLKFTTAKVNFEESGEGKKHVPINWNPLDVALTPDMQAQMMGSYGASFYKLGDKTLTFIVDEKSKSSLSYHLPIENTPREHKQVYNPWAGTYTQKGNMFNTTQQIYIFWAK